MKKSLFEELIEDKELDKKIVDTFNTKDDLSNEIYEKVDGDYKMIDSIKDKLIGIANEFMDFVGVDFFIHDVVLTGSLANYGWSEYSDVDLHILVDFEESNYDPKLLKEFFDSKKQIWNKEHNISIKTYDVELYVQDVKENHVSSGVYSVLNNDWIVKPEKVKPNIDDRKIIEKGEMFATKIDNLIDKSKSGEDITSEVDELKNRIKKFRQCGLEKGGEYSYENLTFKLLRRNGYMEKLLNLKTSVIDKKLSISQQ